MKGEPSGFYLVRLLLGFDVGVGDGTEAVARVRMLCGVSSIRDFSRRFQKCSSFVQLTGTRDKEDGCWYKLVYEVSIESNTG